MCAARNVGHPQSHPNDPKGTGLGFARRLHLDVVRKGNGSPVPTFEFEIENQRNYPRLPLQFPLRLRGVAGQPSKMADPLVTLNISSTGAYFLAPISVRPEDALELEIGLTDRPHGRERVRMCAKGRVVRVDASHKQGWQGVAVTFDEIVFERNSGGPAR